MLERCDDWIGALIDFPGFVGRDEAAPYRPVAVVWFEPDAQVIVDSELVKPAEALQRAAGLFHLATREPKAGKPRLPRRVRVADPALGAALNGFIGDVEVVVGPTPEIDEVVASMREYFLRGNGASDEQEPPSYLLAGVSSDEVSAFFSAAAAFYASAPWDVIPPDEPLTIRCELLGIDDGVAIVVGQLGQSFGVSIYFTHDDAQRMFAMAADAEQAGSLHGVQNLPRHIMVSFDDDIEPSLRREIADHGWRVAGPSAHPRAALIEHDLVSRPLTADELAGVTAILAGIAMLVTENPDEVVDAFDGGAGVAQACEVAVCGRSVNVEVIAEGELAEHDGDPLAREEFEPFSGDDEGMEKITIYCEALVAALGLDWESWDAEIVCLLVEGAADLLHGSALLRLTPHELRRMLTTTIPHAVPIAPADADRTFELLVSIFDLAATRFGDDMGAACMRVLTPAARKRFVAALADETKFSNGKRVILHVRAQGLAPRTPADLLRIAESLERGSANVAMKPKAKANAKSKPKTKAKPTATATATKPPAKPKRS